MLSRWFFPSSIREHFLNSLLCAKLCRERWVGSEQTPTFLETVRTNHGEMSTVWSALGRTGNLGLLVPWCTPGTCCKTCCIVAAQ